MNHEDLLNFKQHKEYENMTNIRKINMINERTGIQKMMSQIFDSIQPSQNGISHKLPIRIDGEGAIIYEAV